MINDFSDFIKGLTKEFTSVVDPVYTNADYIAIDLSKANTAITYVLTKNSLAFEAYIKEYLINHNAKVAYGGYDEYRNLYDRSAHFDDQGLGGKRTFHLGLDVWCDAGTKVVAPLSGVIHSFKNNDLHGDYGPTIIVQHTIQGEVFYTLYGHLSIESLETVFVGQQVAKGAVLGFLGDASVNGDYAPHLHFQLIRDIGEYQGDYPGVSTKMEKMKYLENCPNPNLLLKIRS